MSDDELRERIGEFDGIVIRSATKLTADLIERGVAAQGHRPRRHRRRQRRRRGGDQARDRGRQRARSRTRSPPPSTRWPWRWRCAATCPRRTRRWPAASGRARVRRQRALRQDARRDRLRADRPAGRQARAGVRDGGGRLRQVRRRRALPRAGRRARGDDGRALRAGRHHHDPPAEDAGHGQLDRRRGDRADEGRRPDRQLRARRARRPRRARGRHSSRARSAARRWTSSRRSPSPSTRSSGATTSSSPRTSAPRPRRRRTAPGTITAEQVRRGPVRRRGHQRSQHRRGPARGDGGAGALRAALREARPPRAGARERLRRPDRRAEFRGRIAEHDTRLLGIAVLVGILSGHTEEQVNLVNAPALAEERGIELTELKDAVSDEFTELVTVRIESGDDIGRGRRAPPSARATCPTWSVSGARASTCRSPSTSWSSATRISPG